MTENARCEYRKSKAPSGGQFKPDSHTLHRTGSSDVPADDYIVACLCWRIVMPSICAKNYVTTFINDRERTLRVQKVKTFSAIVGVNSTYWVITFSGRRLHCGMFVLAHCRAFNLRQELCHNFPRTLEYRKSKAPSGGQFKPDSHSTGSSDSPADGYIVACLCWRIVVPSICAKNYVTTFYK